MRTKAKLGIIFFFLICVLWRDSKTSSLFSLFYFICFMHCINPVEERRVETRVVLDS